MAFESALASGDLNAIRRCPKSDLHNHAALGGDRAFLLQRTGRDIADDLVATQEIPLPTHIKIDVDGIEPKVVAGADAILRNSGVRSLMIEINTNLADHRSMVHRLTDLGFKYDPEQVYKAMRRDGPFKGVAEHVFKR